MALGKGDDMLIQNTDSRAQISPHWVTTAPNAFRTMQGVVQIMYQVRMCRENDSLTWGRRTTRTASMSGPAS